MDRISRKIADSYARLGDALGAQGWWPLAWRSKSPGYDDRGYHPGLVSGGMSARDRFEISVGAILTQNTAWINVEAALSRLKDAGLTAPDALLASPDEELKAAIKPCGYYNQKAKKLRILSGYYRESGALSGKRPPSREALLGLWGIGPETADSILLYAFAQPVFVIDAYTKRLFSRLGCMAEGLSYDAWQTAFTAALPLDPAIFNEYHALIVACCKAYCSSKPSCAPCPLKRGCAMGRNRVGE